MTTDPMTVEDFLEVMAANAEVYTEFAALPDEQKRLMANGNIATGTAETFREDGKIVGVGGIRHIGIAEAWFITPPAIRKKPLKLLRQVRKSLEQIRTDKQLWRIFAASKISENFLKHLGFAKNEDFHVWTIDGRPNGYQR